MSHAASLLMLALTCKLLAAAQVARLLTRCCRDFLEALVAGWLFVHLGLLAVMLGLSAAGALTGTVLWAVLVLLVVALLVPGAGESRPVFHGWEILKEPVICCSLLGVVLGFVVLAYRSLYVFDTTREGVSSGVPRILLYAEHQSVFVPEGVPRGGPFADGWNGELNGLFYLLLTDEDQASGFGNVEIFLVSCIGYAWLAGVFGAPARARLAVGLALASAPPLLGRFTTVGGDPLAVLALCLAVGWLWRARAGGRPLFLCAALASLGMAAGARGTVAPAALLLVPVALLANRPRVRALWGALGVLLLTAGASRCVVDVVKYGRLVPRTPGPSAPLANLRSSLHGVADIVRGRGKASLPLLLLAAAAGALVLRVAHPRKASGGHQPSVDATQARSASDGTPWPPRWRLGLVSSAGLVSVVTIALLAASVVHFQTALGAEGLTPTLLGMAPARTATERMMGPRAAMLEGGKPGLSLGVLDLRALPPQRVLVLAGPRCPIGVFFGENRKNRVDLCDSVASLVDRAAHGEYDLIAVAWSGGPWEELLHGREQLLIRDHDLVFENAHYKVFRRRAGPGSARADNIPRRTMGWDCSCNRCW